VSFSDIIAIFKDNDTPKKTHSFCRLPQFKFQTTMVNCHISDDLKMAALRFKARGHDTIDEILQIVQFSRKTFYRVQHQYRRVGTVAKAQAIGRGRPCIALHGDI
jgi:hypothetical protein